MTKKKKIAAGVGGAMIGLLLLLTTATALSHDYWLEPEKFFLLRDENVRVHLLVGEALESDEERPLQLKRTPRLQVFTADGMNDLLANRARDGVKPFAEIAARREGNMLIVTDRNAQNIELEPQKFTAYLRDEGLDEIITERKRRGESDKKGRERYSRNIKSLLQIGERHDDSFGRLTGQLLEIIPTTNPYELKTGDELNVRFLFADKPLANAKVFATHRAKGKVSTQEAMTNATGEARFKINGEGEWLIRLVHMRRCQKNCGAIDWESFWGSYSFGMK